ncbi:MAG: hypothetical protein ACETWB_04810 [Anaerolineae bacterium]
MVRVREVGDSNPLELLYNDWSPPPLQAGLIAASMAGLAGRQGAAGGLSAGTLGVRCKFTLR